MCDQCFLFNGEAGRGIVAGGVPGCGLIVLYVVVAVSLPSMLLGLWRSTWLATGLMPLPCQLEDFLLQYL